MAERDRWKVMAENNNVGDLAAPHGSRPEADFNKLRNKLENRNRRTGEVVDPEVVRISRRVVDTIQNHLLGRAASLGSLGNNHGERHFR